MQANPSERSDNERDDDRAQLSVLSFVLSEHPTQLAVSEILREVGDDDEYRRAVTDLTGAGLLRREGESVIPTRAALHFDRLTQ